MGLVVSLASCGDDGGPGNYLGAPCRNDYDCGGLYCVKVSGGICLPPCRSDLDCGPGYDCSSRDRQGASGSIAVCRPL